MSSPGNEPAVEGRRLRIDLHTHSNASDGTLSPTDLVQAAAAAGLDVLALTDHDTTAAWAAAAGGLPPGLSVVRGAELSCRHVTARGESISLHLLAYLFDPAEPTLAAESARVRASRLARGEAMVGRLRADGLAVDWADVLADARGGTVGRPHIARALVRRGYVPSVAAAFAPEWLGAGGPYWVAKYETDATVAVRLVLGAGGVPVFAHAGAAKRGRIVGDEAIAEMADAGLVGLEVRHPDHAPPDVARLDRLARDLGLVLTGGSDFHGTNKSVRLGAYLTEPGAYAAIVERATGCPVLSG